jgi:hypothetical protein
MATPRTWLPRGSEILEILERMKSQQLDRAAIEDLFELQRRQALTLMKEAGAVEDAGQFLVDRTSLLAWTRRTYENEMHHLERRKSIRDALSQSQAEVQAIREALHREGRAAVRFRIVDEVLAASCATLPPGVQIAPGCVTVVATDGDPHQRALVACGALFALGTAIANDFAGFEALLNGGSVQR